jgi:large subunit ribosomal protein L4
MKLAVVDGKKKAKEIEISFISKERSEKVLYQAVVSRLSHEREGNAFTKTKSEVRGGGKKPWKQKGLGRARAGSTRSPLWRGGGVTFGPKPRDFSKSINKKQRLKAYVAIFSMLNEKERLVVFQDIVFESKKTKDFLSLLKNYVENTQENIVMVVPDYNGSLYLASRNIPNVTTLFLGNIDILPLVYADRVLISEKALLELDKRMKEVFSGGDKK